MATADAMARDAAKKKLATTKASAAMYRERTAKRAAAAPTALEQTALQEYVKSSKSGYSKNLYKEPLENLMKKSAIPAGTQMYRTLTNRDIEGIKSATASGKDYIPKQVKSAAGAMDLQQLGQNMSPRSSADTFGGNQENIRTIASIEAMDELQGIRDVSKYGDISKLQQESLIGPNARYRVLGQTPATPTSPGTVRLGAYNNVAKRAALSKLGKMGKGALGALDMASLLMLGGLTAIGKYKAPTPFEITDFRG